MKRLFAENQGVKIEYLLWESENKRQDPTVVLIHGAAASADYWIDQNGFIERLSGADLWKIIAISFRGQGGSDTPEQGWKVADHLKDIESVLEQEGVEKTILMGHSVGSGYAAGFALSHPSRVLGLVVGDYVPGIPPFPLSWAEELEKKPDPIPYDRRFPRRFVAEAELVDYAPSLDKLTIPLLVLRGTVGDALMPERMALKAYERAPNKRIVAIESGHDVFAHPMAQEECLDLISQSRAEAKPPAS